jgi:hypothetical protein
MKPRKKAPCLSKPINPIPSDAFFITKRSIFLNVLKKLLSIDEHLDSEKFSTCLRSLQYIELSNNKFTEPFINEMFSDQFDSLLSLVMDNNLFNHIPVILSNFRKLHRYRQG